MEQTNKLIAEFMGLIKYNEQHDGMYCAETMELGDFPILFQDNQYNTSWDSLMPVVEKIESLGHELIIAESRCKINHNTDHSIEEVINIDIIGSKIEATYQAVVDFIKEHNRTNDYNKVTYYDGQ